MTKTTFQCFGDGLGVYMVHSICLLILLTPTQADPG